MNTTPSSDTDTIQQARRTEAARWIPEQDWYPRERVDGSHDTRFAGSVGRFMLFVNFDGYGTAEFREARYEAEEYAPWAGSSHGGWCSAILDLDTGDWFEVREVRTVTLEPSTAYDLGMEPDDEEVDA